MKDLIAKRYIKALVKGNSQEDLKAFQATLQVLASAYEIPKFRDIAESPYLDVKQKESFILEQILENKANAKMTNFIKILALHNRLDIFQELYIELSSEIASHNKEYLAKLIVSESYDNALLKEIEQKFSQKLGVNLLVEQQVVSESGIKLVVEDLGVEVSFSQEKFINDLKNHILRAF